MRRQTRTMLLGAFAAAALTALGAGLWLGLPQVPGTPIASAVPGATPEAPASAVPTAEADILPTPPEPPRLADGPEVERCFGLLRTDPEGARAFAEAWLGRGGGDGARHCLALALLATGEPAQAAGRLEALAARSPAGNVARASVFNQATQAWLMAGDANRAVGTATMALTLQPDDAAALIDRALAMGILGRFRESMLDLDRALLVDPQSVEALVFRAAAARHLERIEDAFRDIARALAIDPGNAEALLERGILRQMRGDVAGAREDWERAIELSPNSPTADLAIQNLALNEAGPQRR
jgi:tetratricopeptide (TPR) repeat protein